LNTIADLPDIPKYTIKNVCAQTGIQAVTLRAWERRYRLMRPRRTQGNYRLYSERDVAMLRWLKGRVDEGVAISAAAAELAEMRRSGRWPKQPPAAVPPPAAAPPPWAEPTARYAQRLFEALTRHDEIAAEEVLREAHAIYDVDAICLEVFTPCLVNIGEGWARGKIRVSTEHFASTFIRGRLLGILQSYPLHRGAPRVVVGCAAGEQHEIGALMVALLLRRAGYRVEFLGPDVPARDLLDYIREERADMVCFSAGSDEAARDLERVQAGLARLRPRPKFGFGGRIFNERPALRQRVPGLFLGQNAAEAVATVRQALPLPA
jgi:methanogenic corrinoid protein MtbC1